MEVTPNDKDVLFGRGYAIMCHPGNLALRALVRAHKPQFLATKRRADKREIASAIVDDVHRGGGRFLTEDAARSKSGAVSISEKTWTGVDREKAVDKVMHRFREKDKGGIDWNEQPIPAVGGVAPASLGVAQNPSPDLLADPSLNALQALYASTLGGVGNLGVPQPQLGNEGLVNPFNQSSPNVAHTLLQVQQLQLGTQAGLQPGMTQGGVQAGAQLDMGGTQTAQGSTADASSGPGGNYNAGTIQAILSNNLAAGSPTAGSLNHRQDGGSSGRGTQPLRGNWVSASSHESMGSNPDEASGLGQLCNSPFDLNAVSNGMPSPMPNSTNGNVSAALPNAASTNPNNNTAGYDTGGTDRLQFASNFSLESSGLLHAAEQPFLPVTTTGDEDVSAELANLEPIPLSNMGQSFEDIIDEIVGTGPQSQLSPVIEDDLDFASLDCPDGSLGVNEWMQSACEVSSNSEYILAAVELSWAITKHLSEQVGSGAAGDARDISSDNVRIFVDHLDPTRGNMHDSNALRPTIRGLTFGAADGIHPVSNIGRAPLQERDACASLGQILLDIFSRNQSSSTNVSHESSSGREDGGEMQPSQKRKATSSTTSSKSSQAKALLLSLSVPISISRLICDMLDASRPCTALTSLDEALWDLDQMRSDPETFLFDQTCPQKAMDHFAIADDDLFGRDKELGALMKAKKNLSTFIFEGGCSVFEQDSTYLCEAAFLGGYAGSGKSSLLLPLVKACEGEQWFVLGCKFDKQTAPIKLLCQAFDDFFGKWGGPPGAVLEANPSMMQSFRRVCDCICSTIDESGLAELAALVPNFGRIYPHLVRQTNSPDGGVVSSNDKVGSVQNKLRRLIQVLVESLCSAGRPVLLTLDDLQWCDAFIMEGMSDWMQEESKAPGDACRKGLFIAGAYRSNEVTEDDPLFQSINAMKLSTRVNVTALAVDELTKHDVNKLLSTKLCLPPRYTKELSAVVHNKTRGNPFFVIQFLRTIVSNKMLEFSVKSRRWTWDCDVVDMQLISEGVAGLLTASFNQLPSQLMKAMKVASCLGYQVERRTIDALDATQEVLPFSILDELQLAVKEGIMERAGPLYQFTHDIIQQTIYDLIPPDERGALHKAIGIGLLNSEKKSRTIHLLAVDQLNMMCQDGVLSAEERSLFAKSNAQAAKYAIAASSFEQARSYVDAGINLLASNHWETQYSLSLNLFEMSATVSCISGDIGTMSTRLHAVISHGKTLDDTLVASSLLAKLMASSSNFDDARKRCFTILAKLGEEIASDVNLRDVLKELPSMQTSLSNISYDQIKALPPMTDKHKLNAMKFLNMLCMYCVLSKPQLLPLLSCRMVRLTLEHGFCEDAIVGICTAGYSVFLFTDDIQLASHLERVSEALIRKSRNQHLLRSRLWLELSTSLRFIKEPWHSVTALIPDNYNSAMIVGDVENAVCCRWSYCAAGFWTAAFNLPSVLDNTEKCIREAGRYQQKAMGLIAMVVYNSCSYLMGRSGSSDDGLGIKSLDALKELGVATQFQFLVWQTGMGQITNLFWTRRYKELAQTSEHYAEKHSGSQQKRIVHVIRFFYEGIAFLNLARGGSNANYRALGEKAVEAITKYESTMSTWNFENKRLLLQAELHYLNGQLDLAEEAYEASIRSANAHRFVHELALAYELHGVFCVENGMLEKGLSQLRLALAKYKEWGATRKARGVQLYVDSVEARIEVANSVSLERLELR